MLGKIEEHLPGGRYQQHVAVVITAVGANRKVTLELHAGQIQGFYNIPVDNLYSAPIFEGCYYQHFLHHPKGNLIIVSSDVGGVTRARALARRLGAKITIVDKRRAGLNETEILNVVG